RRLPLGDRPDRRRAVCAAAEASARRAYGRGTSERPAWEPGASGRQAMSERSGDLERPRGGPLAQAAVGHWRAFLRYAAGIVAGVVAWQLIGTNSASFVFVPLTTTLSSLGSLISDGSLPRALASSFSVYAIGVALAIVAGAAIGMLLARRALLRKAFEPYLV